MSGQPSRRFSPGEKLDLVLRSYRTRNIRAFCRRLGVDPTTLYRWRRELARDALASWSNRHAGRPSVGSRVTVEALQAELEQLLERHEALRREARRWQLLASLARQTVGEAPAARGLRLLLGRRVSP